MNSKLAALAFASSLLLTACAQTAPQTEPQAAASLPRSGGAAPGGLSEEDRIAFFVNHARSGETAAVRRGLDEGLPVNGRDALDQTALLAAVSHNALDTVQLLLDRGADPNLADKAGWTPLHFAAYFGQDPALMRLLIERGAKVDAQNDRGITPLYFASATGHEPQVQLLLAKGADRSIASRSGYTPLHVAQIKGLDGIVALLDPGSASSAAAGAH